MAQLREQWRAVAAAALLCLVLQSAVASPTAKGNSNSCDVYNVGSGLPINYVTLEKSLTFNVNASNNIAFLRILMEDLLFKVIVDGSMVKLFRCDLHEDVCQVEDESASKSSDLIVPLKWNTVNVTLANHTITVGINSRAEVISMFPPSDAKGLIKTEVAVVNLDRSVTSPSSIGFSPDYSAEVRIECGDSYSPLLRPAPALIAPSTTTTAQPLNPAPYKKCLLTQVQEGDPFTISTNGTLAMAVFPSLPQLFVNILILDSVYLVTLKENSMAVYKCNKLGQECIDVDSQTFPTDFTPVGQWSELMFHVTSEGISVEVAETLHAESKLEIATATTPTFTVLPSDPVAPRDKTNDNYSVTLNIKCEGSDMPGQSTLEPLPHTTAAPTSQQPGVTTAPEASTGSNYRTVIIIVVVLLIIAVLLAIAYSITSYKKRRSANINQHTPLNEQQHK